MISRIITIDQSTSATKAMLFSEDCELLHRVNIEHQQFYPQIGWVEHDAEEIYKNTIEAIHCLLEQEEVNGKDISYSLAITNQRETVVVWNRHTGKSVYHAVVWQCQRGAAICKELKDKGYSELVQRKTGLLIDPYFSASGAKWILDNVENARELAEKGDLLMGTIDSWLIWKLTKGKNVEETEKDAKKIFPKELWNKLHIQIIYYGREYSPARAWSLDKDFITRKMFE